MGSCPETSLHVFPCSHYVKSNRQPYLRWFRVAIFVFLTLCFSSSILVFSLLCVFTAPIMSSVETSALGMGGSDSGGSVGQPLVEREIIPIGGSSDETSSASPAVSDRGSDNESSSPDDDAPIASRFRPSRPLPIRTPPPPLPLATVLPATTSFQRVTRGRAFPSGVDNAGAGEGPSNAPASEFSWVRDDVFSFSSSMDSVLAIRHMYQNFRVVSEAFYEKIKLLPCKGEERPFMRGEPGSPPFFYFYRDLVATLGVSFPLTDFQSSLLRRLNVAPSQLHANSWAMVRIFEELCPHFNIRPSVAVFLHFYELRLSGKVGWVSLSIVAKRPFDFNVNVFRRYKEHFFRVMPVRAHIRDEGLFFDADGEARFPFYWQPHPYKSRSYDVALMTSEEQVDTGILAQLPPALDGRAILALSAERDPAVALDSKFLGFLIF